MLSIHIASTSSSSNIISSSNSTDGNYRYSDDYSYDSCAHEGPTEDDSLRTNGYVNYEGHCDRKKNLPFMSLTNCLPHYYGSHIHQHQSHIHHPCCHHSVFNLPSSSATWSSKLPSSHQRTLLYPADEGQQQVQDERKGEGEGKKDFVIRLCHFTFQLNSIKNLAGCKSNINDVFEESKEGIKGKKYEIPESTELENGKKNQKIQSSPLNALIVISFAVLSHTIEPKSCFFTMIYINYIYSCFTCAVLIPVTIRSSHFYAKYYVSY